jgi:hypothetical protein
LNLGGAVIFAYSLDRFDTQPLFISIAIILLDRQQPKPKAFNQHQHPTLAT